jgi:hypothetical protein
MEWIFAPHFGNGSAQNNAGIVFSIEKIADELADGGDELSTWAAERGNIFFQEPDESMLSALSQVSQWAWNQNYRPAAVSAFLQDADFYVVAYALSHKHVVVTHEIASDGVRHVKIPNVCIGVHVRFMTPYEMLRREKARFILGEVPSSSVY